MKKELTFEEKQEILWKRWERRQKRQNSKLYKITGSIASFFEDLWDKCELFFAVLVFTVPIFLVACGIPMIAVISSMEQYVDVTVISCEAQESETSDYGSGIRTYSMTTGNLMGVAFGSSMRYNDVDYDAIVEFEGKEYEIVLDSEFEPGETVEVHPDRLKESD